MDRITKYEFALGNIDQVKNGKFKEMRVSPNIEDLELSSDFMKLCGLSLFKLVGVYQTSEFLLQTDRERHYKNKLTKIARATELLLDKIHQDYLEQNEIKETFHPKLIHIGYEPGLDKSSIIDFLQDDIRRIGYSPWDSLPNFYEKNIELWNDLLRRLEEMPIFSREFINICRESSPDLIKQLSKYGTTREEFSIIDRAKRTIHSELGFIVTGPEIDSFNLDRLFKRNKEN